MTKSLTCTKTGQPLQLIERLVLSGEGSIWQTDQPGYLAKLYNNPTLHRIQKLEVMVANPPREPNAHLGHISFAWPVDLLINGKGHCEGFLMPQIADSVELIKVYNPRQRQKTLPTFNWLYLHTTAMNVASIVWAIHEAGYVLGDIKPQNLLVNNRALPAIVDTDSFQVRHPITGTVFRCLVGSEGFTPPELLNKELAQITQAEVHDRFRLAMMIYLMLFGEHPFKGRWIGSGDSPDPTELIRHGFWPYGHQSPIQPGPLTIPLDTIHPGLKKAFLQCFNQGHHNPDARPSAKDWVSLLKRAIADLEPCPRQKSHYYAASSTFKPKAHSAKSKMAKGKAHCYWCHRNHELGVDVFALSSKHVSPRQSRKERSPAPQPKSPTPVSPVATANVRPPLPKSPLPQSSIQASVQTSPQVSSQSSAPSPRAPMVMPTNSKFRHRISMPFPLAHSTPWDFGKATISRFMSALYRGLSHPNSVAQIPAALLRQRWVQVSGAIALLWGLFFLLISVSRTYITTEEMGPTILGGVACLGLVMLGALWLRILKHYNLQDD